MDINKYLKNNPVPCKHGAPMGADDWYVGSLADVKFYLQRLKMVDGAYTLDGTYWGSPPNLWCAWDSDCVDGEARMFVRANSREEAKALVLNTYENAKFYR